VYARVSGRSRALLVLVAAPSLAFAARAVQAPGSECSPERSGISALQRLNEAFDAIGMSRVSGQVLRISPGTSRELTDQSDRAYPPFIQLFGADERWFDPATGVERASSPTGRGATLRSARASYQASDSIVTAAPELHAILGAQRAFNPWAVVSDWRRDTTVRVVGRCTYPDGERIVLARRGALGDERLFLDPRSHIPMRLLTTELHYFLGPVHADYRYSAWSDVAPYVYYPTSAHKLTDGLGQETWTVLDHRLVRVDSAPSLSVPRDGAPMPLLPPPRFGVAPPDTVRVGENTFLLVNDRFTSAVTLARDTVFVLDAAAGEERARHDSTWIATLFPRRPVTLVLLNSVWPHIAGLRFWVASRASVVAPTLSRHTVEQAIARRWTERPDKFERQRATSPLRLRTIGDSLSLAAGAVRLYPLDGAGNEGTAMAYVATDRFLWASDRIQDVHAPSLYVVELLDAVRRHRIEPRWTAGPHTRRVPWADLQRFAP
jgi:hypothetical protein